MELRLVLCGEPFVHLEHVNLYFLQVLGNGSSVATSRPGGGKGEGVFSLVQLVAVVTREDL